MRHELLELTRFCHGCGRVVPQSALMLFCNDTCKRRYHREHAVQTSKQIRRGKRANDGAGSV